MTTTEKMQKSEDLTGKINDLKKSREEALKKNDKEKVSILEIKIDIAECDKKKWELQKKLMQLQK